MSGIKFCPYCGKKLGDGMAFCPYCGNKLPSISSVSAPAQAEKEPAAPMKQPAPEISPCQISGDVLVSAAKTLTKIVVPSGVKVIASRAFQNNSVLREVVLPEGIIEIAPLAFFRCANLEKVELPHSLKKIGSAAFQGCKALQSLSFGENLAEVENDAFRDCEQLKEAVFVGGMSSLGDNVFSGCSSLTSVILPTGIKTIHSGTFAGCSSLTDVSLPSSVTTISKSAFASLPITSINLKNVEMLGEGAFKGCKALREVKRGATSKLKSIPKAAFQDCVSLKKFAIPASVTYIGDHAFFGSGLTSVILSNDISYIGDAFSATQITSISIPLKAANSAKVGYCKLLRTIFLPYGMKTIPDLAYPSNPCLTSISIPETVTSIGSGAFQSDTALTSVSIPRGITLMDMAVFAYCTALTDLYVPSTVRTVAADAFYGCSSLTVHYAGTRDEMFDSKGWSMADSYGIRAIQCRDGIYDRAFYVSKFRR